MEIVSFQVNLLTDILMLTLEYKFWVIIEENLSLMNAKNQNEAITSQVRRQVAICPLELLTLSQYHFWSRKQ